MNEEQAKRLEHESLVLRERLEEMESRLGRLRAEFTSTLENPPIRRSHTNLDFFDQDAKEAGLPALFSRIKEELRGSTFMDVFTRWTRRKIPATGLGGVTVIPGNSDSPVCTPLVVVFVLSGMSRMGIDGGYAKSSIAELKLHLETCRAVRGVLLVFAWDAVLEFDDSLRQWIQAWKSRGIAFSIGVCGPDGKSIQPFTTGL